VLVTPAHAPEGEEMPRLDVPSLRVEFGVLTKNGVGGRRGALKTLSERYHVGVNELYRLLQSDD